MFVYTFVNNFLGHGANKIDILRLVNNKGYLGAPNLVYIASRFLVFLLHYASFTMLVYTFVNNFIGHGANEIDVSSSGMITFFIIFDLWMVVPNP